MKLFRILRIGLRARKVWRLMSTEVGDANQARLAAERANRSVPAGTVLVVEAKPPLNSATISTLSAGGGASIGVGIAGIFSLLFPSLSAEQVGAIGTVAGLLATWVLALFRHRYANANAPGAEDAR